MKKPHAVLVFLAAAWCSPLLAQTRPVEKGPQTAPSSLFDAVGFKAPETPLTKKCSNSELPVTTPISSLPPGLWVFDSLTTTVRPAQYPSFSLLFSETFTSGAASTHVFIHLWTWVSVPTTTSGNRDGVFLKCTVTQGTLITACPGTVDGPALLTQVTPAAGPVGFGGQGLSMQASYVGAVAISADTSTTVDIQIASLTSALTTTAAVSSPTLLLQY